jgi:multimeric flavodoxin WrbA
MKVIAIGGSPRLHGNTNYLIDQALGELASRGIDTEKIVLNEYKVGPCQAHENCASFSECQQKDDGQWILEKFSQADGVILASPVYFGTISAQMKAFMDRSFFLFRHDIGLNAKCVGLIAIAGRRGAEQTVEELKKLVRRAEAELFTLSGNSGSPDIDPKTQMELTEQARNMGKKMAEILAVGNS